MEILLALVLFVVLFMLSYYLMNSSFIKDKYNPFKVEVPSQTAWVVDRFGHMRFVYEGFQNFLPLIDEVEIIISLKEEIIDLDKLKVLTLDNQKINLEYHLSYQVVDPVKAINKIYDYKNSLKHLIRNSTLTIMSKTRLDDINSDTIQQIRTEIEKESKNWGIEIPKIFFDSISL
ncbi:MAG: Unknown protein [uncultured Sulfurovum sp.]|uniref:U-box domain-containing protein n=1 Tax=uncultured Sulfurovum sp. TaxID=269237 RepID=A0A6S6UD40_9BACT|nr:MAG: Unknown protein [uncultured Sulfurovum sp.]